MFVGTIHKLLASIPPWWLRSRFSGALLQAFGVVQDDAITTLSEGLKLGQPLRCDASALPILSRDRGIRIFPTEPDSSKRTRLAQWRQLRRSFGTHEGEMRNLQPYFFPSRPLMRIVHQDGAGARATWHTLDQLGVYSVHDAEPSNWNFDGATAKWSRFWVIIYRDADMTFPPPDQWDDGGTWDDGSFWDGGPSAVQIADILGAVLDSKSAHSTLWGIIMCNDPTRLDPAGTSAVLGDGSTTYPVGNWGFYIDNTTGLPSRPPFLSWLYDLGQG